MLASRKAYLDKPRSSPELEWGRWRDTYIRNQGHKARGDAFEQVVFDQKVIGEGPWGRNLSVKQITGGVDRNYDAFSAAQGRGVEIKSSGAVDYAQLAKDRTIVDSGYDIHYILGDTPSGAAIDRMAESGVAYEVFHGQAVVQY